MARTRKLRKLKPVDYSEKAVLSTAQSGAIKKASAKPPVKTDETSNKLSTSKKHLKKKIHQADKDFVVPKEWEAVSSESPQSRHVDTLDDIPGYEYLPSGNAYISSNCNRLSLMHGFDVVEYKPIESDESRGKIMKGKYFPKFIVEYVKALDEETKTKREKARLQRQRRSHPDQVVESPTKESDSEIGPEAPEEEGVELEIDTELKQDIEIVEPDAEIDTEIDDPLLYADPEAEFEPTDKEADETIQEEELVAHEVLEDPLTLSTTESVEPAAVSVGANDMTEAEIQEEDELE